MTPGVHTSLLPIQIAETFDLKIETIADKSIIIRDIQGKRLCILGKTLPYVTLTRSDKILKLEAYVTKGLREDEVMIGLSTLLNWQLLPPNWLRQILESAGNSSADVFTPEITTASLRRYAAWTFIFTMSQMATLGSAV